jgi:hypothetical protein
LFAGINAAEIDERLSCDKRKHRSLSESISEEVVLPAQFHACDVARLHQPLLSDYLGIGGQFSVEVCDCQCAGAWAGPDIENVDSVTREWQTRSSDHTLKRNPCPDVTVKKMNPRVRLWRHVESVGLLVVTSAQDSGHCTPERNRLGWSADTANQEVGEPI